MGLAAACILEQAPTEDFRDMIHDEVDKWVDQIIDEVFEDGKEPTVMELSQLFSETKQRFFGACFQALIEQKYAGLLEQEYAPCPQCGKMCKKRRGNLKQMVTMQGPSVLKRPWFYCVDCSYGFSPLDKALEISRKKYQFDVQKKSTSGMGSSIKGQVKRKNTSPLKKMLFFSWLQSLCISTALFDTPIRTRYFSLFGSRSGLLFVSS